MKRKTGIIVAALLLALVMGGVFFYSGGYKNGIPFVRTFERWSISIYEGNPVFVFPANNTSQPMLSSEKISGFPKKAADPFLIQSNDSFYIFFESINASGHGDIALAKSSDAKTWEYAGTVLNESFHLSYPYVFEDNGSYYLVPQSSTESVRLYKAAQFPLNWTYVKDILSGDNYTDSSLFHYNGTWYMFTTTNESRTLRLFYADSIEGPWIEHPKSPIYLNNSKYSRGAGRITQFNSSIIRYAQDDESTYGKNVYALNITVLNRTDFSENLIKNPVLQASNKGWNENGMHHISPLLLSDGKWIAAVDGKMRYFEFNMNY